MAQSQYNFGLSSTGGFVPSINNGSLLPNSLQTNVPSLYSAIDAFTPSASMYGYGGGIPSLSPQQMALGSGMPITPTIGGTSNFSNGGFNLDLFNNASNIEGNPLGLKLGAEAGGGLPKIAMTDKIKAGVGVFNSALDAVSAHRAYKLGKENLAFQKESFNKNYDAMKRTTNAELSDRQRARVQYDANNGTNSNMSVADYMAQYGVK